MTYNDFFSDETKRVFEEGDFSSTDNEVLIAMLDDIVQVIADKSHEEWTIDNSKEHRAFRKLKKEIYRRLADEPQTVSIMDIIENYKDIPVLEHKTVFCPFDKENTTREQENKYTSFEEFYKTIPNWAARAYDYAADRPTYYLDYEIKDNKVIIPAANNSTSYLWEINLSRETIEIKTRIDITD